ncbi:TIM-barrel domain-containing protein [Paenibacillus hodogayensis]|uniref:TIM-barrel domain-containing protein n=1 Tax=Paenibacillus hodogayensis TaxID=279208 RepID=A0ABV5VTB7_9BACL
MEKNQIHLSLQNGEQMRIQVIAPDTFRIRISAAGDFREPALIRYGILDNRQKAAVCSVDDQEHVWIIRTERAQLRVEKSSGRIELTNVQGELLTSHAIPPWSNPQRGFGAEFQLADEERLYGLGDETRERIQKRGHRANMWVANVKAYAPIPFLMSSKGWGLLINTTWRHAVDIGSAKPDRLRFWGRRGELDYYLFAGETLADLLQSYTSVAGKPQLLPIWSYGLTFVCNEQANAREMIDDALNFRREGIPCDLIGLEPGWMEKHYDYSVNKNWHPERFAIPKWLPDGGPATFFGALERLGFKLSLWLCADYDLSLHEERLIQTNEETTSVTTVSGGEGAGLQGAHPDDYEQDTALQYPVYMDGITKRSEAWYTHLNKFVRQGVSAFKLDGAKQVLDHPDRLWGNGMSDEEMHNLYPLLLAKQMYQGFREQAGRRPMIYTAGGYAGIQQYAATWAGDTGGGPKPLVSLLNHGLSGHANTSCDMDVFTPAGLHFGFLQPWSQVNSWAYWRHPWLLDKGMLAMFKMYAKLRYRLLPYIYATAHVAARSGMPIVRAMPVAFPDDPHSDELLHQYMLGDFFLVAAFTDQVYLPEGEWIDYWTGKRVVGPANIACDVPAYAGGPLFVRAGAIIPTWPEMDYVGEKSVERLGLRVYPCGDSEFTLYEDDGTTFAYEEGKIATTSFVCREREEDLAIHIGVRAGSYKGMPESRSYNLVIDSEEQPAHVTMGGEELPQLANSEADRFDGDAGCPAPEGWIYDPERRTIRLTVAEDEQKCNPLEIRIRRSTR